MYILYIYVFLVSTVSIVTDPLHPNLSEPNDVEGEGSEIFFLWSGIPSTQVEWDTKKTCMKRDSYLPGITKWDPFWGRQTWCKSIVVLRDFSLNGALFGLDIFILTLVVIHCCWCFIPPPFSTFFLRKHKQHEQHLLDKVPISTGLVHCRISADTHQISTQFWLCFCCAIVHQLCIHFLWFTSAKQYKVCTNSA